MHNHNTTLLGVRVAELGMWLDASTSGIRLAPPNCLKLFTTSKPSQDDLRLHVNNEPFASPKSWRLLFDSPETWQLWQDQVGRYIFTAPKGSPPPRLLTIDANFSYGELAGEFISNQAEDQGVYPLRDMDMVLYVNWLARYGDLIVHAAGISDGGEGYCFVGSSGVGKSTLAASVASDPGVIVLGEDQVILRYLNERFHVFGTPWHTNPNNCSPTGAPLKKIFFLERNSQQGIMELGCMQGMEKLLQDGFIPYYDHVGVNHILDNLSLLAQEVPFYTFSFKVGEDVMKLIRNTL